MSAYAWTKNELSQSASMLLIKGHLFATVVCFMLVTPQPK